MANTITLRVDHQVTTLDLLLWRHFRSEVEDLVETVLATNRGLAAHGAFLPVGTLVTVPLPARAEAQPRPSISLYD